MATPVAEFFFPDTNVLLSATDESRDNHLAARTLLARGRKVGIHCAASGQIFREYLVVETRSVRENGLGLSISDALNIDQFARRLMFCDETEAVSKRLRRLALNRGTTGKSIHDANVVATMATHGIPNLVTENASDFRRYPEVSILGVSAAARLVEEARQGAKSNSPLSISP